MASFNHVAAFAPLEKNLIRPVTTQVFRTTKTSGNAQVHNIHGDYNVNPIFQITSDGADKIFRWLAAPDSSGNYNAAREKHHERTGAWFIESKEFNHWKEIPDSAIWVHGIPGCGKTVIWYASDLHLESSHLLTVHRLVRLLSRNAQTELSTHTNMLRSIIRQLSHQSPNFPAPLVALYDGGHQQPSIVALEDTIQQILQNFERTYLILDAVDECTDREKALIWIKKLMRWQDRKIHIMLSSRPDTDIEQSLLALENLFPVSLAGNAVDKDIESYLDAMLATSSRWDVPTRLRVRDVLLGGAGGMFRWVALQILELAKCYTRRSVEAQLQSLPRDLEGIYDRILSRRTNRDDLKRFLLWLAFSNRPLGLAELSDVVTVDFALDGLPTYREDLRYFDCTNMLTTCSGFVTRFEGI
ncbi:hypothetical protein HWV62_16862 [Athelia sp. TMB]|nr:hypothetical protein HWV62_16862 [Athelia sp. TMB]